MHFQSIDWKKGIALGAVAGVIWGWIAMLINAISGAFQFENSIVQNFVNFAAAGAVFGIVISGFLSLLEGSLPFKNIFLKTIFISTVLWVILRIGGMLLSSIEPERYHLVTAQTVQGFILSIIMGCILGIVWKLKSKEI